MVNMVEFLVSCSGKNLTGLCMLTITESLDSIGKILIARRETIGLAESVTAGNLQAAFSLAQDATRFFQGGITTYNLGQKARHLHIDPIAAENCNCVSPVIAQQMARRARRIFSADWGIGITGYAAPLPEWEVDTLLFAYYSIVYKQKVIEEDKLESAVMPMKKVQDFYIQEVVNKLKNVVNRMNQTEFTR